jgi:glycerate kinase|tara:strand:- start:3794 stop:4981 length:1188 start_codon:yes stop_codon:yes gene_type:complete
MRVLIAFDKFKDALTASEACEITRRAVEERLPSADIEVAPLTDGGEGFVEILTQLSGGTIEELSVAGPRFEQTDVIMGWAELAELPESVVAQLDVPQQGRLAIIEMAQASGLELLNPEERDPWQTSTFGTGELIAHATEMGAAAILLGIGGSATNDLGLGALEALSLQAYQADLQPVPQITPEKWSQITSLGGLVNAERRFPPIRIACDVDNPLLGEHGATHTFGPQKGLKPEDIDRFERGMRKQALRLLGLFAHEPISFEEKLAEPGSGAAGGIGFGLRTSLPDARYVAGFPLVEAWLQLAKKIDSANLVITGEGAFDASSLRGKGPGTVVSMAEKAGRRVQLFAGAVGRDVAEKLPSRAGATAISPPELPLPQALKEAPERLKHSVEAFLADL